MRGLPCRCTSWGTLVGSHAGPHAPQDYEKLDAYYVTLTVHKQRKSQGDELPPHLEATIRGLEEHQPPVMAGDTVRLRHDTEPQVEVRGLHGAWAAQGAGCGAWAWAVRCMGVGCMAVGCAMHGLLGAASITNDSLPSQPPIPATLRLRRTPRLRLRPTLLQVGLRVVNVVNRTTLVMNADANMLRHVNAMLLSRGRPDVFAPLLPAAQPGKSRPKRSRLENCHLRFSLNRKPMQFMRYLLCMQDSRCQWQRSIRGLREMHTMQDGRPLAESNRANLMGQMAQLAKHVPEIVPLLPTEADLLPAAEAAARAAPPPIEPLQPQLNALQRSAVQDVLAHRHGRAPYIVFGPPGTGKTMVMLECILQACAWRVHDVCMARAWRVHGVRMACA